MELPLFPLNTVLFPGATLPLHIFEERYKQMIGLCLQEQQPFGVLLIRQGKEVGEAAEPFEIGTTARIARVEHLPEGRMNLVCLGGKRFRVVRIMKEEPYLVGEVEVLTAISEDDAETADLADTASALFAEYTRLYLAMSNQWARSIEMPREPGLLSDFIGSRLGVSFRTKQRILEELSARRRLEMEVELLGDAIREMTSRIYAARAARWYGFAVMN